MNNPRTLTSMLAAIGTSAAMACSCFGPQTFCETLNPPYPDPEWWIPDAIVLGVKLGDNQHGMDVKIVQSFSGSLQVNDTIRVWGDCGLLCRHYPGTWAVGDTVLWGFKITDLMGNGLCGTSYEQPTDYMISICGIYYLDYAAEMVSGPITSSTMETMPLAQLGQLVTDCLSTGVIEQPAHDPLVVWYDGEVPVMQMDVSLGKVDLSIRDALGREVMAQGWDGSSLRIEDQRAGIYLAVIRTPWFQSARKIVVR